MMKVIREWNLWYNSFLHNFHCLIFYVLNLESGTNLIYNTVINKLKKIVLYFIIIIMVFILATDGLAELTIVNLQFRVSAWNLFRFRAEYVLILNKVKQIWQKRFQLIKILPNVPSAPNNSCYERVTQTNPFPQQNLITFGKCFAALLWALH